MVFLILALLLLPARHTPTSPLLAYCQRLAAANVATHASTAECYRCETHGSVYMLFLTSGDTWQCDDPRW